MWKEFKAFAFKGNVLDLAVAFILGAAFTALVQAVVGDLITPILSIPGSGKSSFATKYFTIGHGVFQYGDFLNRLLAFLLVALVLFLVIKAITRVERLGLGDEPGAAPSVRPCPYCFETINVKASRCPRCTSELPATA